MTDSTSNQSACDQIELISKSQSITLDPEYRERIMGWKIDKLKKIWAIGTDQNSDTRVLIKVRPVGSILPIEEFIETERLEKIITDFLSNAGVPTERILREQLTDEPQWVLREFREGSPIGKMSYNKELDEIALFDSLKKLFNTLDNIPKAEIENNFPERNWIEKWKLEFADREQLLLEFLGAEAVERLHKAIPESLTINLPKTLLHNDLAPQNIINSNGDFSVIDWGEASYGPRVIDWATVWSFAIFHPDLQSKIVQHIVENSVNEAQDKLLMLTLSARLLASIAEYHHYRVNLVGEAGDYDTTSLETAWHNFERLEKELQT